MINHATTLSSVPNPFVDDSSRIPGWQRRLHFYTEVAALLALPKLFSAARDAGPKHKGFLTLLAWGTLAVDGFLVYRWLSEPKIKSNAQHLKASRKASEIGAPPVGAGAPAGAIRGARMLPPGQRL